MVIALLCGGCAPSLMKLPSASGAPASDAADALRDATSTCRGVSTMSAELGVSGSIGGQGVRGRMLVGLAAPASARLEAVAPFGQPAFIFVARGDDATLLLPRDDRVLEHGKPETVLEAVAGVPLAAADLRSALTGCSTSTAETGKMAGDDWRIVIAGPSELYLHRDSHSGPWQLAAVVHRGANGSGWRAEYRDFQSGLPRAVRLTSLDASRFDLRLLLSQLEINTTLGADVFQVTVPPTAVPISLAELKASSPLRGKSDRGSDGAK
jgi:outer membrane lipoprotein-sorting protein